MLSDFVKKFINLKVDNLRLRICLNDNLDGFIDDLNSLKNVKKIKLDFDSYRHYLTIIVDASK